MPRRLISSLLFPELERQLMQDPSLWPDINGLYIIHVTKRRRLAATWYLVFQGNATAPVITTTQSTARRIAKRKLKVVSIQMEDRDVLNFITGGLKGVNALVSRKVVVKGDLAMAQQLEQVFEKAGGRERALSLVQLHEHELFTTNKAML